jgi:hypothetical protein
MHLVYLKDFRLAFRALIQAQMSNSRWAVLRRFADAIHAAAWALCWRRQRAGPYLFEAFEVGSDHVATVRPPQV